MFGRDEIFMKQEYLGLQEEVVGAGSPQTNRSSHGSLSPRDLQRSPQSRHLSPTVQDSPVIKYMDNLERNGNKEVNRYNDIKMETEHEEALDMQVRSSQSEALDMSHDQMKQTEEAFRNSDIENGRKVSYSEGKENIEMQEKIRREFSIHEGEDEEDRRAQIAQTAREIELLRKASNGVSPHSPRDSQLDHFSANQEPYSQLLHPSSVNAVSHSISS